MMPREHVVRRWWNSDVKSFVQCITRITCTITFWLFSRNNPKCREYADELVHWWRLIWFNSNIIYSMMSDVCSERCVLILNSQDCPLNLLRTWKTIDGWYETIRNTLVTLSITVDFSTSILILVRNPWFGNAYILLTSYKIINNLILLLQKCELETKLCPFSGYGVEMVTALVFTSVGEISRPRMRFSMIHSNSVSNNSPSSSSVISPASQASFAFSNFGLISFSSSKRIGLCSSLGRLLTKSSIPSGSSLPFSSI